MQPTTITSTAQLKAMFPELPRTDKFKRCIDKYLAIMQTTLTIQVCEPLRCFTRDTTKGKRNFKVKISNGTKCNFAKRTRMISTMVTQAEIDKNPIVYMDIKASSGCRIMKDSVWYDLLSAKKEQDDNMTWGTLAYIFGTLLKDEFEKSMVYIHSCGKCNGTGLIPEFMWYANGVCFQCMGTGKWVELTNADVKRLTDKKATI